MLIVIALSIVVVALTSVSPVLQCSQYLSNQCRPCHQNVNCWCNSTRKLIALPCEKHNLSDHGFLRRFDKNVHRPHLLCDFSSASISCTQSDCTITVTKPIGELLIETSYCQAHSCPAHGNEHIGKKEKNITKPPKFTEKRDPPSELPRWPQEKNPKGYRVDDGVSSILDQLLPKPLFESYIICFVILQMGLILSQLIAIVVLSLLI